MLPLVVVLVALCAGCAERRANNLYEEAQELVEQGDIDGAVERLETLLQKFPDTEIAERARKDVGVYRFLAEAVEVYPIRQARDAMVKAARAIELYRDRRRKTPESLEALVPDRLAELPVDPWSRPLIYRQRRGGRGYVLACFGRDGQVGGEGEDVDLFIVDGRFTRRPAGERF